MGDTDNDSQPSKKRSVGVQLSHDNPGLDDNEDTSEQESGTFKRARNDDDSKGAVTVTSDGVIKSPAKLENNATEESKDESADGTFKSSVEVINNESEGDNNEPKDAKGEEYDKKKENTKTASPFSSFKNLSSGQNAFSGIIGTGFSTSSFSFGSISKESGGANSNSLFSQGVSDNKSPLNFGSSVGNTVSVLTGEENERVVFTADSALYEFTDGVWKEKGKGELKVNVSNSGPAKARLVMRARGNYRLILNASLFPDMKLTGMEKKGITFPCVNIAGEGRNGLSTIALKFRDASIVEEFRAAVTEHKGEISVATLKTPENSPTSN